MYRGEFLKACKKAGINIEGGLFYVNGESVLKEMPVILNIRRNIKTLFMRVDSLWMIILERQKRALLFSIRRVFANVMGGNLRNIFVWEKQSSLRL